MRNGISPTRVMGTTTDRILCGKARFYSDPRRGTSARLYQTPRPRNGNRNVVRETSGRFSWRFRQKQRFLFGFPGSIFQTQGGTIFGIDSIGEWEIAPVRNTKSQCEFRLYLTPRCKLVCLMSCILVEVTDSPTIEAGRRRLRA